MFTLGKSLDKITEDDLAQLISESVVENRQLEYKRQLPGPAERDKKEFTRDVVSFANSAGGHIIYGIAAEEGIPKKLVPIAETEIDSAKLRLESVIRTTIEPTVQGLRINSVKITGGAALIIEIPRALFGLHMIKNRGAFISRTSAGKSELDVNEIRAAFVGAQAASDKMRDFRAERTWKIQNNDTFWPLLSSRVGVLHLIPLASFTSGYTYAIDRLPHNVGEALYPMGRRPSTFTPTITFEGYANLMRWSGEGAPLHAYSHLFRNGTIESVNAEFFDQYTKPEGNPLQLYFMEILIMDCAERMLTIMQSLEIPGPFYLLLALLNIQGLRVCDEKIAHFDQDVRTLDRESVILPEVLLERSDVAIEPAMQTSFNMIWNAFGWNRSPSYDEHGHFKQATWRNFFKK